MKTAGSVEVEFVVIISIIFGLLFQWKNLIDSSEKKRQTLKQNFMNNWSKLGNE